MKRGVKALMVCFMVFALGSCESLMERTVEKRLTQQRTDLLQDGKLHVILVGSGGPINNTERLPSSTAVIAGGEFMLVDAGPGTVRNADLLRLPLAGLTGVFVTHFHSDHIGDLGDANFQSWAAGRQRKLEIYGPKGVEKIVQVTPALEHIVEANILLSGIGFESAGLATAHSVHNGLTALAETHLEPLTK